MTYQPPSLGWFDGFRSPPFPTFYADLKTPVTHDVLYVGWGVAFVAAFVAFCFILPGVDKDWKRQMKVFLRVTISLVIGLIIMLCNFGQEWEVGMLETKTAYRAGSAEEIQAAVGVKLGLRSVNITLKATKAPEGDLVGETVDYNERFSWEWAQGRAGFGPFAGAIQQSYRAAQFRGTPLPILWVAEYFTFDGEGIRFGRFYRTAGWYAHMCIWLTFPLWILMVILFKMRIDYGALMMTLTGALLVIAALIWSLHRNFIELVVPFADGELKTKFGIHWYLSLILGLVCLVVGALFYLLHWLGYHDQLSRFFGNNPLQILHQETLLDSGETDKPSNELEMGRMDVAAPPARPVTLLRGRGTTKRFNKMVNYPIYSNTPARSAYTMRPAPPHVASQPQPQPGPSVYQGTGYNQQAYQQGYGQQDYPQPQNNQGYVEEYGGHGYNQNQAYQEDYTGQEGYPQQDYPAQEYHHQQQQDYSGQGYDYNAQGYQQNEEEEEELYAETAPAEHAPAPPRPPKKH